jgi:hypothetical protein
MSSIASIEAAASELELPKSVALDMPSVGPMVLRTEQMGVAGKKKSQKNDKSKAKGAAKADGALRKPAAPKAKAAAKAAKNDSDNADKNVDKNQGTNEGKNENSSNINPQTLAKLEQKIIKLEAKKTELEATMATAGFYQQPHDQTTKIQTAHTKITNDLQAVEAEWLEAQEG